MGEKDKDTKGDPRSGGRETKSDPRGHGRKVPQYQSDPEEDDNVDLASEDSFPASDPPSYTSVSHPGNPCEQPKDKGKG